MIYAQISSGRGPDECSLEIVNIVIKMIKEGPGGILVHRKNQLYAHSCVVGFDGPGAEEYVRSWEGTIKWVCNDPLNRRGKDSRKNWYVGVKRIDLPFETEIKIRDEDISIQTMRASGKGGQHVNKTDTKVRLTHKPSGISVVSEQERSQKQNLKSAKQMLLDKLKEQRDSRLAEIDASNWGNHNTLERGNPVRTFYGPKFSETP